MPMPPALPNAYQSRYPRYDLRDRAVRTALPVRENAYWHMYASCRHLGYQKWPSGRTTWLARIRLKDGRLRQQLLGQADDNESANGESIKNFEQALHAAKTWCALPEQSQVVADGRAMAPQSSLIYSPVGEVFTIAHAIADYLEWKQLTNKASYVQSLLSRINYFILPEFGTLAVDDVDGEMARRLIRKVLETPPIHEQHAYGAKWDILKLSPEQLRKRRKSANAIITVMKHAMRMAWEDHKTQNERSWRVFHTIRNVDQPRVLHLSRSEVRQLLSGCSPELGRVIRGLLYTGCRFSELMGLVAADVGRDGYGIYVKPGKSNRPRFVFLPDEAMVFFLELSKNKSPGSLLFKRDNGERWSWPHCRHCLKKVVRKLSLPDETCMHTMRHTYASQLIQAGAPFTSVSEQLGHVSPVTVMRVYGHLSPQIRESEIRQRFTSIDSDLAMRAERNQDALREWRAELYGGTGEDYARINQLANPHYD